MTLYFYNSTENGTELGRVGDQHRSDAPRGRYENGIVTVKLFPVQVEDSGQYVCAVTNDGVYQEAIAQVIVAGFGSAPRLTIDHQQNNSVTLRCMSQGWYPQPEVCWTDSTGQNITAMAETRIQKDGTDLYQIHSTLRVADTASDTISCTIRNPLLKRHRKKVIAISGVGNETSLQMHLQKVCKYECKWKGWYPKPMVFWRNHKGQSINSLAETTEVQDEQNLFTVASTIAVSCDTPEITCAIVNTESEMIQQSTAQHFVGFLICILLFIAVTVEHFFGKCKSQFQNVIDQVQRVREQSHDDYEQLQREIAQLKEDNERKADHSQADSERKKDHSQAEHLEEEMAAIRNELAQVKENMEWRMVQNNSDDITLDADTAHPNLSIAPNKKSLKHEAQPQKVPANAERFDSTVCVLGSEGFFSGKHYWEVEVVSSTDWDLGVARTSIQRKGKLSLSPKEGFWALGLSGRDYWAKTDPWTRVMVQKKPQKIGVYLSHQDRQVTFLNVTDMSVLFTFNDCSFSGEVYPFFKNSHKETTMRICSIKEE
nr:butyrophilin subfamily 1 member A1-like isoform X1 [Caretta caretta]